MLGTIAGDITGSVYEGKMAWQSARTPALQNHYFIRWRVSLTIQS